MALKDLLSAIANDDHENKERALTALLPEADKPLDVHGNTYVHLLASHNSKLSSELLKILLEKGANPNVQNVHGQTPMHIACANQSFTSIHTLAAMKGDFFQKDNQGIPPLALIAVRSQKKDPLKLELFAALTAAFIVSSHIAKYALDKQSSSYLVAGLITLPELLSYGTMISQLMLAIQRKGISEVLNVGVQGWFWLYLAGWSPTVSNILHVLSVVRVSAVASSAFQGLRNAWKYKHWQPLRALRNGTVHAINLAHATHETVQEINQLGALLMRLHLSSQAQNLDQQIHESLKKQEKAIEDVVQLQQKIFKAGCESSSYKSINCKRLKVQLDAGTKHLEEVIKRVKELEAEIAQFVQMASKTPLDFLWEWLGQKPSAVEEAMNLLGVDKELYAADPKKAVNTAFRQYSRQWHPDKCKAAECADKFDQGTKAKDLLLKEQDKKGE